MTSEHPNPEAAPIKQALSRQFGQLAEPETRYQMLWHRAAEGVLELDDQDPVLQSLMHTGKWAALVREYFRDIAAWDSLADLAIRFDPPTRNVPLSDADIAAFLDAVLHDIAVANGRRRDIHDLTSEDIEAICARNSGNWIGIDPGEVSHQEPLEELAAKSPGFGDLVENAVAAGYQTDAVKPVLLSFHFFCIRQAMRAEALGTSGEADAWLSDQLYDDLLHFVSELAGEMRDTRVAILARSANREHVPPIAR